MWVSILRRTSPVKGQIKQLVLTSTIPYSLHQHPQFTPVPLPLDTSTLFSILFFELPLLIHLNSTTMSGAAIRIAGVLLSAASLAVNVTKVNFAR